MAQAIGIGELGELYSHLAEDILFEPAPGLPEELEYDAVAAKLRHLAENNTIKESFLGDGLPAYSVHEIVPYVANLRKLSTAYTPYQPERSQGTLMSLWIYQCLIAMLTGFEAINSSLYDRASALFEAASTALRIKRSATTILIPEALYPGDLEVIRTLATGTDMILRTVPLDTESGRIAISGAAAEMKALGADCAALIFPQINNLGILEDVDELTDRAHQYGALAVAVIDPILLGTGGLKPPSEFGTTGADLIVGEGQHLAIGPNFGGPGLGLFGVRYNAQARSAIRATPGRYVGKALDLAGRECRVMVLATREQHIRKGRATSNICSNQAFLATLAGAALLARGESGLQSAIEQSLRQAQVAASRLQSETGVRLAFPEAPFFNEFVIELGSPIAGILSCAGDAGLHLGVDVSDRLRRRSRHLLKLSFSDRVADIDSLIEFLRGVAPKVDSGQHSFPVAPIPAHLLRQEPAALPEFPITEIKDYYRRLGDLNVSPDDGCYPLGSCTMKYNPYLNDWAANQSGFANMHPQAPIEDAQGSLEILFEIQEWFKLITGLAAVTTQPVAGAQGELVGIKMFQAYHRDRDDRERDVILIPRSAHGTNFATAVMAGYPNRTVNGRRAGICLLDADNAGRVDMHALNDAIARHGHHISGVMITNPNTSGIFESHFKTIADKIHEVGGLVYMDGANMNAIAGWVDLGAMGVDAVHNNLHKTWTIPHGGGGPGDAIVAVSERLSDFLPGYQVDLHEGRYNTRRPQKSIGSFHRHWGNFGHKIRCYAYLLRLGREGVRRMSAVAVLASRYLFEKLKEDYLALPIGADDVPRMHEFILSLDEEAFRSLERVGISRAAAIPRLGKLFLDFGFHAPTVAWPEAFGMMIEPTESYSKAELDRFAEAVSEILSIVRATPEVLQNTPHFTPVDRIDEVTANRNLCLSEPLKRLPLLYPNRLAPEEIAQMQVGAITHRLRDPVAG